MTAPGLYRLLSAQSPLGHALYVHYGLDPQDYETNILIADGVAWFKSESSIRMAEGLGFPWSLAAVFRVLPMAWRDRLYETVARNRLRWFGKRDDLLPPRSALCRPVHRMSLRVLILGGYGTFGGRLARLLADEARLTLIIAGRSLERAEAFCAALPAQATLIPAAFDRDGDADAQLAALAPDIVVDASGPFQVYGDPYRVVRAAIARGIGYLDLADGSEFVKGIAQFDAAARERGVFVLSGVSSVPVLTAAVVRRLGVGMTRVDAMNGRHRAVAVRRARTERGPRDRELLRQAGHADARRPQDRRLWPDGIAALHDRAARPAAARQQALFAGRCARPVGAAGAVAVCATSGSAPGRCRRSCIAC